MNTRPMRRIPQRARGERRGSTLLIVVALLGMLAFLGFVFYTFAKQERENAVTFSQGAKILKAPALEADALFDFAMQQVLLGPSDEYRQSILWGGRHSLLANMFGRDGIPWNGEGVNLLQNAAGQPLVDMNHDGTSAGADTIDNPNFLDLVDSPAANAGNFNFGSGGVEWGFHKRFRGTGAPDTTTFYDLPEPDVNYNSPDVNSIFLSYDGIALGPGGATPSRVIIPSFLRPQFLRSGGTPIAGWYRYANANQVMRPHPGHVCVNLAGNPIEIGGNNVPRYVSITETDTSVTPNRPLYQALKLRRPFTSNTATPFIPTNADGSPSSGNLGVWSGASPLDIALDVDTDGDGVMDAILMDLGHPPIRRGDGKLVVPLFAISIRDLNGLLNVNAAGNIAGNVNLNSLSPQNQFGFQQVPPASPNYAPDNISKSNLGVSTYEINVQRALTADPINDSQVANGQIAQQLGYFLKLFDTSIATSPPPAPRSVAELANIEWYFLNIGKPTFNLGMAYSLSQAQLPSAIINIFAGRNGEMGRMRTTFTTQIPSDQPGSGVSVDWSGGTPTNWPANPGNPNPDDNVNFNEGESVTATRWGQPLDFRGSGRAFYRFGGFGADGYPGRKGIDDDGNGIIDDLSEEGSTGSDDPAPNLSNLAAPYFGKHRQVLQSNDRPIFWPGFLGYHSFNRSAVGGVQWGEQQTTQALAQILMSGSQSTSLLDDPTEAIIDPLIMSPRYVSNLYNLGLPPDIVPAVTNSINYDSVFAAEEMLFLQGSASDGRLANTRSRLAELMPANLVASQSATEIRKRLTTISQDRREFGHAVSYITGNRLWEVDPLFPPHNTSGPPSPYRPELYRYLSASNNSTKSASLKLNVNRWLYLDALTNQYGFAALPEQTLNSDPSSLNATLIRQNMARDIYTLLYTLCHVHTDGSATSFDTDYRTALAPTAAQAKEMAQFAVNLVDSLDSDNVITPFYYKPNLSDAAGGWSEDPYFGPDGIQGTDDDTVVFGVERQMLTFHEAMSFTVQSATTDDLKTIFDDSQTPASGRTYLFFELQNVSPMHVKMASAGVTAANASTTADWRVKLTDSAETTQYNILYFLPGLDVANNFLTADPNGGAVPGLAPGATFSVASQDGSDTISGRCRTSDYRADLTNSGNYALVVPRTTVNGVAETPVPTATTPATQFRPKCNLDLVWDYGDGQASPSRFVVQNNTTIPGSFVSQLPGKPDVRMILERRVAVPPLANGTAGTPVWVAVDKTSNLAPGASSVDVKIGQVAPATPTAGFDTYPRLVPMLRASVPPTAMAGANNTLNRSATVVVANPNSVVWQSHNDREFASLSELLQLPLYGPEELTAALAQPLPGQSGLNLTSETPNRSMGVSASEFYTSNVPTAPTYLPSVAAARFLRPDNPDYTLNGTPQNRGNRWYRLLEFLEVPNRSHQHQALTGIAPSGAVTFGTTSVDGRPATFTFPGTPGGTANSTAPTLITAPYSLPQGFGWPKTHGLVNLNMVRHPQVLMALIDDDQVINDPRLVAGASAYLDDASGDTPARQWWVEFLRARDSRFVTGSAFTPDPVTNLFAPGTANSRPFRSIDFVGPSALNATTNDSPIENTIFRSLPLDAATNPNESRRLFEVGSSAEHFGQPITEVQNSPLHPSARYRLLSKLMNNTTTRSNSFGVFVTVQYFEAAEVVGDNGTAIRIGGRLDDTPTHRGFFVVDRTGAIEQMKRMTVNPVSPYSYSFQADTNRTGNPNGIRWKDLVLLRQILN